MLYMRVWCKPELFHTTDLKSADLPTTLNTQFRRSPALLVPDIATLPTDYWTTVLVNARIGKGVFEARDKATLPLVIQPNTRCFSSWHVCTVQASPVLILKHTLLGGHGDSGPQQHVMADIWVYRIPRCHAHHENSW